MLKLLLMTMLAALNLTIATTNVLYLFDYMLSIWQILTLFSTWSLLCFSALFLAGAIKAFMRWLD